jgi:protein SCO1
MKTIITTLSLVLITGLFSLLQAQHDMSMGSDMAAKPVSHSHSLHYMNAEWTDQNNTSLRIEDFAGKPLMIVMFYGKCAETCPILIQRAWSLYSSVDESMRSELNVMAVSFDYRNDTPEALKEYAEFEQLDIPGWHFVTAPHSSIRELATLLGVQYRELSDGHFAHSNLITILDQNGVIQQRIEGVTGDLTKPAAEIETLIQQHLQ